jgi:uncharacterized membrane protein (DUF373 family)
MSKKLRNFIQKFVHILEGGIAILTLVVLIGLVGVEIYKMFTTAGYFFNANNYLHNILTIIVGLEFVRMLINLTPANTLEVLIVAIARQVIVNHNDSLSNIACVTCIAGLFAIRKFLISRYDLKKELSDDEDPECECEENEHTYS